MQFLQQMGMVTAYRINFTFITFQELAYIYIYCICCWASAKQNVEKWRFLMSIVILFFFFKWWLFLFSSVCFYFNEDTNFHPVRRVGHFVSALAHTKAIYQLEILTFSWIIFPQQMAFLLTYFNVLAHWEEEWVNRKQTVLLAQQSHLRFIHVHFFLAFVPNPKRQVPGFPWNNKVSHKPPNMIVNWMPTVSSHLLFRHYVLMGAL